MMITSQVNPKVKYVRRLQSDRRFRYREQAFIVEGTRWVTELVHQKYAPQSFFCTEDWQAAHSKILQQILGISHQPCITVSPAVMAAMSDTKTPSGVLAVVSLPNLPHPETYSLVMVLDSIHTPGNLGTMLRTASAAGADAVLLGPDCVDPTNPKVVRGSMGALLRIPVWQMTWDEIKNRVAGLAVWVATVTGDAVYTAVDWQQPSALIIGSEAAGVGTDARKIATGQVSIPMAADTESLNAAMAAGIMLFEARRQRDG